MSLSSLEIEHLRIIDHLSFDCSPGFNLIVGKNGQGKTSILEAIHILGLGRSFRTRLHSKIIQDGHAYFRLVSKIRQHETTSTLGIERHRNNAQNRIRIDGQDVHSNAALAELLPLLSITSETFGLLHDGSKVRRAFIDWGTFHMNPNFLNKWQEYQRIIVQRNAILKSHPRSYDEISHWDTTLVSLSNFITQERVSYLERLKPHFDKLCCELYPSDLPTIDWKYVQGWPSETPLHQALIEHFESDKNCGFSQRGPHRANLKITVNGHLAQDYLSRGQQKLLIYALKLAQGICLKVEKEKSCIYLLDDLPAELDQYRLASLLEQLKLLNVQSFITSTSSIKSLKKLSADLHCIKL